jgi:hypothetical protein
MRDRELSPDGVERLRCGMCDVAWHLTTIDGRVALTTDRKLSPNEAHFIYSRR